MIDNFIQTFKAQESITRPDGFGGKITKWTDVINNIQGYLDLTSGSDINQYENAITEQSTHVLIIPKYRADITDKMRIIDSKNRAYFVNYVDDPVGVNHHLEIYLTYDKDGA